jgi:hypothetical protein
MGVPTVITAVEELTLQVGEVTFTETEADPPGTLPVMVAVPCP